MSEEIVIDGYRLGACAATGSTSQIYEVFDVETNERFAMKLLLDEAFKDPENRAVMKREFNVAKGLDHPNLMTAYVHRQSRKNAYFLMEFFGGASLKQIIRGDVVVVQSRFRKLLECICLGLAALHEKGWLHRDIKPDNIMMTKGTDVRIIDFSLSGKIPSAVSKLMTRKVKHIQGTRTYIAPEIIRRKLPRIESDIYSLGVTVFECLTGRAPFMGSTPNDLLIKHIQEPPPPPSAHNSNITPEMDKFVLRLMSKKPEQRPSSAAEVLSEFRSIKIFKEDPEIFARQLADIESEKANIATEGMLDSRADAERGGSSQPKQGGAGDEKPTEPKAVPPAAQPAKPQPAQRQPAALTQPVQRQPQQPGYPPGMVPAPNQPGGQPQRMPPQSPPTAPQRAPAPNSGQRTQAQPPVRQQPPKAQPQKPQPPAQPAPPDDLPFADELPDIS